MRAQDESAELRNLVAGLAARLEAAEHTIDQILQRVERLEDAAGSPNVPRVGCEHDESAEPVGFEIDGETDATLVADERQ